MKKAPQNPVEQHFAKSDPLVRDVYAHLLGAVESFGPIIVEAKKTSIHLCHRTAFAGVRVRSKYLILTVKSDTDITSKRIVAHEQTSANRWHLDIRLSTIDEVDKELLTWLRNGYDLSS